MRHAGIKPVAMIEESDRIVAPRPGDWVARLVFGARVLTNTRVVSIFGHGTVSGVEVENHGAREVIACDGIVFSGRFVPETAIVRPSHLEIDPATGGPVVDQYGRCSDPLWFAAGNLLRPDEASWTAWGEGRAVAHAIAASLHGALPQATSRICLEAQDPVRYVCPQRIASPAPLPAALPLDLRMTRAARGRLRVRAGKRELWGEERRMLPGRRILVPLDTHTLAGTEDLIVDLAEPSKSRGRLRITNH
jgi:hypothetical protein